VKNPFFLTLRIIAEGPLSACHTLLLVGFCSGGAGSSLPCVLRWLAPAALIGNPPAQGASAAFCVRVLSPSAGRGLASVVSIPSERRVTGTECKGSFRRPLSCRLHPQDFGLTTAPALGVAGGGTLVDGGGYLRDCVGGARTVCAALIPTLCGFSSGLMGSDDAASLSYPHASRACGLAAVGGRSADGGASLVGGGPTGNRVGSRSDDLVSTVQHLLYAGAASLTRRPMRAVLVELGRDVRHFFYCSGLKGSTSTALPVSPPPSEACGGAAEAAAVARGGGGGGGGVAGGGTLADGGGCTPRESPLLGGVRARWWRHGLRHWSVVRDQLRDLGPATATVSALCPL
jgi:hypothetical protein